VNPIPKCMKLFRLVDKKDGLSILLATFHCQNNIGHDGPCSFRGVSDGQRYWITWSSDARPTKTLSEREWQHLYMGTFEKGER
jgi:hypothetical protein